MELYKSGVNVDQGRMILHASKAVQQNLTPNPSLDHKVHDPAQYFCNLGQQKL
jgi:hypothetical protein